MAKHAFIMYTEYIEHFSILTNEELGELMRAVFLYEETGEVPELEGACKMAFSFIRADLDSNREKYEEKCKRNASNGKAGGRPKNQTDNAKTEEENEKPKKANGFQKNRTVSEKTERFSEKPKKADNDNEHEHEHDNDNEHDNDTTKEKQEKESGGGGGADENVKSICEKMQTCWNMPVPSTYNVELLCSYAEDRDSPMAIDMVLRAIEIAAENNKPNVAYAKGILNNWRAKGFTTLAETEQERCRGADSGGLWFDIGEVAT